MKFNLYLLIFSLHLMTEISAQTETCLHNANDPNLHKISQVVGAETISREYILHVPQNYDASIPSPLIINLHGFGDCASDYSKLIGEFYNFNELADEENIILAYPQGAYRPEKEDTYWEPGDNGVNEIDANDVYFIEELVSKLSNEFNLNPEMIYACGYSNGGMMAYSLGCNSNDLFSAIGIMSGTMLEEDCSLENPIPIVKFHGIDDEVLPYNGSQWYQSVEEVVNFWLNQNAINSNTLSSTPLNGGKVILDEYSGGNSESCLQLYTIIEEFDKPGGHVWFSDAIEGSTPNNIMWNFFKENCAITNSTSESTEQLIELYPNPVEQNLIIDHAMSQEYSVSNLDGKLLLKGRIKSNAEAISMQNLQSGMYIIRIGTQTRRVLKVE